VRAQRFAKVWRLGIQVVCILAVTLAALAVTRHAVVHEQAFSLGLGPAQPLFLRLATKDIHQRPPATTAGQEENGRRWNHEESVFTTAKAIMKPAWTIAHRS